MCFEPFRTFCGALNGAAKLCTAKNGTAQVGAQECPKGVLKVLVFPTDFDDFGLLRPQLVRHSFAIRVQNI